jgi:hypothetical protein
MMLLPTRDSKSVPAIVCASTHKQTLIRYSEVYWVDASNIEPIIKSLEDIARAAGVGNKSEDAVLLLASRNAKPNWVMLFNNADDPTLEFSKYFPKCTHGSIIITTRNRQARRYGLGEKSDYAVSGMEHDEAYTLLIQQARLFSSSTRVLEVVAELIKELDYFPLSVSQAGAYIFITSSTPMEYLHTFRTRRKLLLRKHEERQTTGDYQYTPFAGFRGTQRSTRSSPS